MKPATHILACALLSLCLSACVAAGYAPAPYYGGVAPYYGTAYAPTYVGVYESGAYYPHYNYHSIHSGYNNGYWHYQQHAARAAAPAGVAHGGGAPAGHGGGEHGGDGHR